MADVKGRTTLASPLHFLHRRGPEHGLGEVQVVSAVLGVAVDLQDLLETLEGRQRHLRVAAQRRRLDVLQQQRPGAGEVA